QVDEQRLALRGELRLDFEPGEKRVDALADGHDRHSRTSVLARAVPDVPRGRCVSPRMIISLLLALAPPVVGNELVWRTTSAAAVYQPARQAARIEPDHGGYVVGWSEVDDDGLSHGYAGRLDGDGELTAIGVQTAGAAGAVSVARSG